MDKHEIQVKAKNIKTVADLANVLNQIKQSEFSSTAYPVTEKQLLHYCNPTLEKRYKTFLIRKKSGGTREINAPCYQLGIILHILNIFLKAIYVPNKAVMGFVEGKSVVDNAAVHVGHHYVFNIDLHNFFPTVSQGRIWKRLQMRPFNFPDEIARVIAGLCCTKDDEQGKNVLPQGSATSPLLANSVCEKLDRRMLGVAKRFGLHYTRYADDMTFSSMHNVYQENSEFRREIERLINQQGFVMNDKKTRLLRDGERQEVTGLTVNTCVNVTKKYVRDLRCLLHVWEIKGYGKAYSYFYPHYKHEKGYIKKGEPVMENVIGGKLNYLRMVKGDNNIQYQKLLRRYNALQQVVYEDNESDDGKRYIYVYSYPIQEFEKDFNTHIVLSQTSKNKLIGSCMIAGMDKVLAISKTMKVSLNKYLNGSDPESIESRNLLDGCYITLCRKKGKNFWLMSLKELKRDKCLSIQNAHVDIDELLDIWKNSGIELASEFLYSVLYNTPEYTNKLKLKINKKRTDIDIHESTQGLNKYKVKVCLHNNNKKEKSQNISLAEELDSIPKDFEPSDDDKTFEGETIFLI